MHSLVARPSSGNPTLIARDYGPRIIWQSGARLDASNAMKRSYCESRLVACARTATLLALVFCSGCMLGGRASSDPLPPTRVLAIAPVINLSGSSDFDALKLTDLVASEFLTFRGVAVVPVNLTLAELERQGRYSIETPEDAVELARALGADATIVVAVTEYNPYSPPVVGLTMQWYDAWPAEASSGFDPRLASRTASGGERHAFEPPSNGPRWQVQRVFNAANVDVLKDIRSFASQRTGDESPYGWRKYTKSQELYVRYCNWAMIRTMLRLYTIDTMAQEPNETES